MIKFQRNHAMQSKILKEKFIWKTKQESARHEKFVESHDDSILGSFEYSRISSKFDLKKTQNITKACVIIMSF